MALHTSGGDVRSGEREFRVVVVETGRHPSRCCMADLAILREARRHVVGALGALVVLQVTVIAGGAQGGVLAVRVALHASGANVRTRQRELSLRGVIEHRAGPIRGGVAKLAILRESRRRMGRIVGPLIVLEVTVAASGAQGRVLAVRVALHASGSDVRARQRELGLRGVIEHGAVPVGCGVAQRTILRESGRNVVRIGGRLVILQMTVVASGAQTFIDAVGVALQASGGHMFASEREGGLRIVIELRPVPIGGGVALRAV